jgi:hypothetical protein
MLLLAQLDRLVPCTRKLGWFYGQEIGNEIRT